jgi:hypothetical protein
VNFTHDPTGVPPAKIPGDVIIHRSTVAYFQVLA